MRKEKTKKEIKTDKIDILSERIRTYLYLIQMWSKTKDNLVYDDHKKECQATIQLYLTKIKIEIRELEYYVKEI